MYQNVQLCELTTHERGQDESDFCDFEALSPTPNRQVTPPHPSNDRALPGPESLAQGGLFKCMSPASGAPSVPFCSATRTLRDRAVGVSYREEPAALVLWVEPSQLRKRKSQQPV